MRDTNTEKNIRYGNFITQRISDNYQFNLQRGITTDINDEIDAIIIKTTYERAVLEYATDLRDLMRSIIHRNHKNYILDLSSALFMDSTFLGSVILILKQIKAKGSNLYLILDFKKIKILAPFNQLNRIITVYNSLDEAIDELSK